MTSHSSTISPLLAIKWVHWTDGIARAPRGKQNEMIRVDKCFRCKSIEIIFVTNWTGLIEAKNYFKVATRRKVDT